MISKLDELSEYLQEFFDEFSIRESTAIDITERYHKKQTWDIDYISHTLRIFSGGKIFQSQLIRELIKIKPLLCKRMGTDLKIGQLKTWYGAAIKIID